MNSREAGECMKKLREEHKEKIRKDPIRIREVEEQSMALGEVRMKYGLQVLGEPGDHGYPVYIALHGGGEAPFPDINNQQWNHMYVYYRDSVESGIYVNPRGVRDTWDTHANPESYPLYDRLIENLTAFYNVDPNRIYLLGFSAGGDGVYLISPRMADRFAAVHMSAGHPNDGSMVNLYNTPIQLQVGMNDFAYDRNHETVRYQMVLDRLRMEHPEGYTHNVYVHVDKPHNFYDNAQEYQQVMIDSISWLHTGLVTRRMVDSNAVHFLREFTRNPLPDRVIWDLNTRDRLGMRTVESFYWLKVPAGITHGEVSVSLDREHNRIRVERDDTNGAVRVLLRDEMLDLDRPVKVEYPDGKEKTLTVERSEKVMRETLEERGDPCYIFAAELPLGN